MSITNPSDKSCWNACVACHRCADKGKWESCASCSGRHDPARRTYEDPDDYCDCRNGILRWKTQKGKRIVTKYPGNPFAGKVESERETKDEQDYQSYLNSQRERQNNPTWDPVQFSDGSSSNEWLKRYKQGY